MTFRGSVTVAPRTRCTALLSLNVWRWTGDSQDFPTGCPKSYQKPVRHLRQIISDRAYEGLDLDLNGDRAAIVRRARGLLQAWRHGDHFQDLIEESDWVAKNAPTIYAGYELDEAAGGIIYVGFTVEPEAMLEKLKQHLIAPDRFKPFPVTPTHSEAELEEIWNNFPPPKSPLWRLVNMSGIDYLANKIEVGTEHVARVRRLITELYGPDAPFEVVFSHPAVLL